MSPRAAVLAASLTLQHVPDLVRYGSKPSRERARLAALEAARRSYDQAVAYPPHQVFIGNLPPEALWDLARPWWGVDAPASPSGRFGDLLDEWSFYELLAEVDRFELVRLKEDPRPGELTLELDGEVVGAFSPGHDEDQALTAHILLENLACKAGAVHATRRVLDSNPGVDPSDVTHVLNCGEEAVGDRYQRGGGGLAKAIAEDCGLTEAGGFDVKAFCAGPIHALVTAAALVETGVARKVVVTAGGSVAKLGMKSLPAVDRGVPVLEDVLAATGIVVGPAEPGLPVIRTDAVGRHRVGSGSSQQGLLEDLVGAALDSMRMRVTDVDRFATELHDPEITEPAGGGDVPDRNYRMIAGLGVLRGELEREGIEGFVREHGMPGFSPTQGHIASAMPWLPHALQRFGRAELRTTMLIAKGSLFLGRMTRLWDGASITLEV